MKTHYDIFNRIPIVTTHSGAKIGGWPLPINPETAKSDSHSLGDGLRIRRRDLNINLNRSSYVKSTLPPINLSKCKNFFQNCHFFGGYEKIDILKKYEVEIT